MNGTEVTAEEVKGKTVINIQTSDADIYINGVCIWSKFDKPEYNEIPVVLRTFVQERNDYLEDKGEQVTTDLYQKNSTTCATFYIPKNKRKAITARLDLVSSMEDLEFEYLHNMANIEDEIVEKLVSEFKERFKDIEDTVKSAGYKLAFSHKSGEFLYGWWDVIFPLNKWDENTFLAIWDKFSQFNQRLNEVFNQYGK